MTARLKTAAEKKRIPPDKKPSKRALLIAEGSALALAIAAACAHGWLIRKAETILAQRIASRLSAEFHSPVTLGGLQLSFAHGLTVYGENVRVRSWPGDGVPGGDLIVAQRGEFRTTISGLIGKPIHLDVLRLRGVTVDIPVRGHRDQIHNLGKGNPGQGSTLIDQLICEDSVLLIERGLDSKSHPQPPIRFVIDRMEMDGIAPGKSLRYDVQMQNPRPPGEIHASGHLGPSGGKRMKDLPVEGSYEFAHADLASFAGIAGKLSSTGYFKGELGHMAVDGSTDTPDFSFTSSGHSFPLHTEFHGTVDGTTGDVHVSRVRGRFLRTNLVASGSVTRVMQVAGDPDSKVMGYDVEADLETANGRVEDVLRAAASGEPTMTGSLELKTHLSVPPGTEKVMERMKLRNGSLRIAGGRFPSQHVQDNVDAFSARSTAGAKAAQAAPDPVVDSSAVATFTMDHRVASLRSLTYSVPGADVQLDGQYRFVGKIYDFHGRARMRQKASGLTTGWKSFFLKLVNPLFEKNGAGTDVPVEISGIGGDLKWRLDYGHKSAAGK